MVKSVPLVNTSQIEYPGILQQSIVDLPWVYIVTVVFNGETALETTILFVIKQSYNNIEYIIINGNSQDRTLDIIHQYEEKISYWCSESERGIYAEVLIVRKYLIN